MRSTDKVTAEPGDGLPQAICSKCRTMTDRCPYSNLLSFHSELLVHVVRHIIYTELIVASCKVHSKMLPGPCAAV